MGVPFTSPIKCFTKSRIGMNTEKPGKNANFDILEMMYGAFSEIANLQSDGRGKSIGTRYTDRYADGSKIDATLKARVIVANKWKRALIGS